MTRNRTYRLPIYIRAAQVEARQDVQGLIFSSPQARTVATALVRSQAFRADLHLPPQQWFHWKCGIVAPCGCDCRLLNGFPDVRRLLDRALIKAVRSTFPDVAYVVGVANAGIPWAKTLADRLHVPLAYVRSTPKAMGKGHLVECRPQGGQRALLIEDIVVSGQSTRHAIDAIHRETDLTVIGVQSIVNWHFPSSRVLLGGYQVRALTSYPFIVAAALQEGMIDEHGFMHLMAFYQAPYHHPWAHYYQEPAPAAAVTLPGRADGFPDRQP